MERTEYSRELTEEELTAHMLEIFPDYDPKSKKINIIRTDALRIIIKDGKENNELYDERYGELYFNFVVVKRVKLLNSRKFLRDLLRTLTKIVHPCVVLFYGLYYEKLEGMYTSDQLVFELLNYDDFNKINYLDILNKEEHFILKIQMLHKAAETLKFLYSSKEPHLMINPSNVKFNSDLFKSKSYEPLKPNPYLADNLVKLTEVGFYRQLDKTFNKNVIHHSNFNYMGPEMIAYLKDKAIMPLPTDLEYLEKWDVWSFGCLIFSLMYGTSSFSNYLQNSTASSGHFLDNYPEEMSTMENELASSLKGKFDVIFPIIRKLLFSCLQSNHKARLPFSEILKELQKVSDIFFEGREYKPVDLTDEKHEYKAKKLNEVIKLYDCDREFDSLEKNRLSLEEEVYEMKMQEAMKEVTYDLTGGNPFSDISDNKIFFESSYNTSKLFLFSIGSKALKDSTETKDIFVSESPKPSLQALKELDNKDLTVTKDLYLKDFAVFNHPNGDLFIHGGKRQAVDKKKNCNSLFKVSHRGGFKAVHMGNTKMKRSNHSILIYKEAFLFCIGGSDLKCEVYDVYNEKSFFIDELDQVMFRPVLYFHKGALFAFNFHKLTQRSKKEEGTFGGFLEAILLDRSKKNEWNGEFEEENVWKRWDIKVLDVPLLEESVEFDYIESQNFILIHAKDKNGKWILLDYSIPNSSIALYKTKHSLSPFNKRFGSQLVSSMDLAYQFNPEKLTLDQI